MPVGGAQRTAAGTNGNGATGVEQSVPNAAILEEFLEQAPDAIIGVGPGGRIALANRAAERLFGHGRDGLIGEQVEVLLPDGLRSGHGRRKDGSEFPAEVSHAPVDGRGGLDAIASVRDDTARAEAERARAEA